MGHRPRLAVLASGTGSNLRAIVEACIRGDLPAEVALVLSNRSSAGALALAGERSIPAFHVSATTDLDPAARMLELFDEFSIDAVILAGYLKLLDARVVAAYRGRTLNIHPAPLPRFGGHGMYGDRVHQAVLDAKVDATGPTIHRVTDEYDAGEIVAHRRVEVRPDDTVETLGARVLAAEHDLYWRTIRALFCRPMTDRG